MAAKTEAKEAPAAAPAAPAPAAAGGGGIKALLPALLVVVLTPAACWAVAEYVLLPRLEKKLAAGDAAHAGGAAAAEPAAEAPAEHGGGHGEGKGEGKDAGNTYEFTNVVVNLSGTMGTRYLKCSFVVTGAVPDIKAAFEAKKAQLTDVTLNVLSSLTLADLEEPGSKNVLRERLVATYNQTLGRRVADQVYFSDFVVQ